MNSFLPIPADHPFPLQNLPYGVFRDATDRTPRLCVRIGDHVLDLKNLEKSGYLREALNGKGVVLHATVLNPLMAQGRAVWSALRKRLQHLLSAEVAELRDDAALRARVLRPVADVELCMPVDIGDYTDFYSSRQHAYNVGCMFRNPDKALMSNWLHLPVGYHGRASSIVLSGTPVRRPHGQTSATDDGPPTFGPSKTLDFELEMGCFVGPGNPLGTPLPVGAADDHIFGMVIVNDWSARDIQRWEYQPLGPFLAKNFATTISPWVVPMEALAPFRVPPPEQDPQPLPYLRSNAPAGESGALPTPPAGWTYDIQLEVALQTAQQTTPHVICRSNFRHLYWTMAQQLAHHTITGCNMRPGDLLASGTISGPTPDSYGSMLELAWKGTKPLKLPSGEERRFLQDRDTVIMRAWCEGNGYRIGFGDCTGTVTPAAQ
jgi:fumarylacetoacetase